MRFVYVIGVKTLTEKGCLDALAEVPHVWPAKLNKHELLQSDAVVALPSWAHSDHLIKQRDLALDFGKKINYVKTVDDIRRVANWARGNSG